MIGSGIVEINKLESLTENLEFQAATLKTVKEEKNKFQQKSETVKQRLVSCENSNFSKSNRSKTKTKTKSKQKSKQKQKQKQKQK